MAITPYDWIYLCSDPRRLAITLRTLPPTLPGLRTMHIGWLSHLDPASRGLELLMTAKRWAPPCVNDVEITDLSTLEPLCPRVLLPYYGRGFSKNRWTLGVKLLLPIAFTTRPFLYTDDDVLLTSDPSPLMHNSFGTSGNFKFFKGQTRLYDIATQLADAMGCSERGEVAAAHYDARILDAGVFFVRDARHWAHALTRFARCPYILDLDPTGHEFRRLDQRFLTAFGIKHGWDRLHRAWDRRNCYSHPTKFTIPNLVKGTVFVHYKTGRHKADWMTALETFLKHRA